MSDQKPRSIGRGRGRGKQEKNDGKHDDPWTRSRTFETKQVVRRPKEANEVKTENKEYQFSPKNFPPLTPEVVKPDNIETLETKSKTIEKAERKDLTEYLPEVMNTENSADTAEKQKMTSEEKDATISENVKDNSVDFQEIEFNEDPESVTKSMKDIVSNDDKRNLDSTFSKDISSPAYLIRTDINKNETFGSNLSPYAMEFYPQNIYPMNPVVNDFVPNNVNSSDVCNDHFLPSNMINYNELNNEDAEGRQEAVQVHMANLNKDNNENRVDGQEAIQLDGIVKELDSNEQNADLEETLSFIYTNLNENPGNFDGVMEVVTPYFTNIYLKQDNLKVKIINILYDYALADESFAFFAVKILRHLVDIDNNANFSTRFRDMILNKSREETVLTHEKLRYAEDLSNGIASFFLFISELYIQMEVSGGRIRVLCLAIGELLNAVLNADNIPLKERLVTIQRVMKLTGTFLDEDDMGILDFFVRELRAKMDKEKFNLDLETIQCLENLISYRNSCWGANMQEIEPEQPNCAQPPPLYLPNDITNGIFPICAPQEIYPPASTHQLNQNAPAVFYGPDGQILSQDELQFLEANTENQFLEPIDGASPESMDREMHEAYQQFVRDHLYRMQT